MVNPFFPSCPRVTVWLWVTTCGDNIRSLNLRPCVTTGLSQMAPVPVKSPFSETSFLSNELKEQGRLPVPIRGWGCPYQDGPKEKPSTYPRFWAKVAMRAGLGCFKGISGAEVCEDLGGTLGKPSPFCSQPPAPFSASVTWAFIWLSFRF